MHLPTTLLGDTRSEACSRAGESIGFRGYDILSILKLLPRNHKNFRSDAKVDRRGLLKEKKWPKIIWLSICRIPCLHNDRSSRCIVLRIFSTDVVSSENFLLLRLIHVNECSNGRMWNGCFCLLCKLEPSNNWLLKLIFMLSRIRSKCMKFASLPQVTWILIEDRRCMRQRKGLYQE